MGNMEGERVQQNIAVNWSVLQPR